MATEITHIEIPENWGSKNDYDSHRPLLWLAIQNISGFIAEFGSGEGSTELLKNYYSKSNFERFESYETNKEWAKKTGAKLIPPPYLAIHPEANLLFIDSAPGEERKYLIAKNSYSTSAIIVHDTEPGADYVYGMSEILNSFKYRLDYKPEGKPHTTIVSNFINVEEWI